MNSLRLLLFPVGILYGCVTAFRNWLFDRGIKESFAIPGKSICIGNLSVGGTGKTPHVAYLAQLLQSEFSIQILSRGYGRETRGFLEVHSHSNAQEVGDEPLFYATHFPKVRVAVCESRKVGIQHLRSIEIPDVLLLDDAFQHRAVKAGMNILLTQFEHPYFSDFMLPAGNLREWKSGKSRADIVIVTKCPSILSPETKESYRKRLKFDPSSVYFSSIVYGEMIPFHAAQTAIKSVLLVTGIANPEPLKTHLAKNYAVELMQFPDHHDFTLEDIQKIHKKFDTFASENKVIVTTEKDFMRLKKNEFNTLIQQKPWFYQSISVQIDRESEFNERIQNYVRTV